TLLVLRDRARSEVLRRVFAEQLEKIRDQGSSRESGDAPDGTRLSDPDKAVFYSNWYYSGIRLSTYVPGMKDVDSISTYLRLPKDLERQVVEFLSSRGLVREGNEKLELGPKTTSLEPSSPFLPQHHGNWRMRSLERMRSRRPHELFYTCPM